MIILFNSAYHSGISVLQKLILIVLRLKFNFKDKIKNILKIYFITVYLFFIIIF